MSYNSSLDFARTSPPVIPGRASSCTVLRKALGEDRNLILTVPLRGYRFTGEVRTLDAEGRPLPAPGPAPEPARQTPTNLPAPVSDFIGRETELRELRELLRHNRLVSVVGTGGIGKTRLGLEAARAMLEHSRRSSCTSCTFCTSIVPGSSVGI